MSEPAERFRTKLREQLEFLQRSCDAFDCGAEAEAIRMAIVLRILFHNTKSSTSLITHLGKHGTKMLSSSRGRKDATDFLAFEINLASPRPVITSPILRAEFHEVPLSVWLSSEPVFVHQGRPHPRRNIILSAANKDGGAHVDRQLDAYYEALASGKYLMGIKGNLTYDGPVPFEQGVTHYADNAHLSLLRQFAFETIASAVHFRWLS